MDSHVRDIILKATGADDLFEGGSIQSLWSGYGSIDRYGLIGSDLDTVVVKHVRLPDQDNHPQGWNTDRSHQRKLHSYQVETAWYEQWADHCGDQCRIPHCLALEHHEDEVLMVLEDLDSSGFPARKGSVTEAGLISCLDWLAHFHATFMGEKPEGLWDIGTYWHLDTRPDELEVMDEGELKQAAQLLDQKLTDAPFQTFVHGDAKLANFCFSRDGVQVAAVDFQYVGGGCGMKDVAYFIGSCLDEDECERREKDLLDAYFSTLRKALALHHPDVDAAAVEAAWRPLYSVAWTDFYRFLKGWSPGHWKIHRYSERLAHEVVSRLQVEQCVSTDQLQTLAGQAVIAAQAAGEIIRAHNQTNLQIQHKEVGTSTASQVVTEVDHKAQAAILEILEPTCVEFDLALLAEESPDDGLRQQKRAFWCIDPMDGTLAFINGKQGYSVSIALVSRTGSPLIGVVYDPVEQTLYQAVSGRGVFTNDRKLQLPGLDPSRPLVLQTDYSFKSHPWLEGTREGLQEIAQKLGLKGADIHFRTGAVMNACSILKTPNSCYFKYPRTGSSGGSLWDYAATACLFDEAGAVVSDIHGAPLDLNRPDSTFMNHRGLLYTGQRQLADQIMALYSRLQATQPL